MQYFTNTIYHVAKIIPPLFLLLTAVQKFTSFHCGKQVKSVNSKSSRLKKEGNRNLLIVTSSISLASFVTLDSCCELFA